MLRNYYPRKLLLQRRLMRHICGISPDMEDAKKVAADVATAMEQSKKGIVKVTILVSISPLKSFGVAVHTPTTTTDDTLSTLHLHLEERLQKRAAVAKNAAPPQTAAETTRQMIRKKGISTRASWIEFVCVDSMLTCIANLLISKSASTNDKNCSNNSRTCRQTSTKKLGSHYYTAIRLKSRLISAES